MRRALRRFFTWLIWTAPIWAVPCAAFAEEPCREVSEGVLCTKVGFEALVQSAVDNEEASLICEANFRGCTAEKADLKHRLDQLLAQPCPLPQAPARAIAPALGTSLVFVGVLSSAVAPFLATNAEGLKLGLGLGGALAAVAGTTLMLPLVHWP